MSPFSFRVKGNLPQGTGRRGFSSASLILPFNFFMHEDAMGLRSGSMFFNGRMIMFILWIVFFILVVVLIYGLMEGKKRGPGDLPSAETPLYILKKRYAQGELTKEEYERIKKDLME